jgi:hypothetical protein
MKAKTFIPLNGYDTFMVALDQAMRRLSTTGNMCHLLLRFPHDTDVKALAERVTEGESFRFLTTLRLQTPFLRSPRWLIDDDATTPSQPQVATCQNLTEVEKLILENSIDPRRNPPFGVLALPQLETEPGLLIFWHHSLCDAKGGERLTALIGSNEKLSHDQLFAAVTKSSLRKSLQHAHKTTTEIFSKLSPPLARLKHTPEIPSRPAYHKIRLTEAETNVIDKLSEQVTHGIFPMALFLAATSRAVAHLFNVQPDSDEALCVTVPHDMRRALRSKALLSNQVSSLFFRVPVHQKNSLSETTNTIIAQMHDALAGEHHHGVRYFFDLIKWLPPSVFWRIIERPGRGHPASMYFSDVGSSLSSLTTFLDVPISYASHYPPNLSRPGVTVVWSRYRNALEITLCYDSAVISAVECSIFTSHIFRELLNSQPSAAEDRHSCS